jgi:ectoine hydroxylase-related dioxygenase (phytanoyl-CoA dioxygenase family)
MESPDSWLRTENCSIDEFIEQVSVQSSIDSYPHADRIEKGAVVYDSIALRASTSTPQVISSEIADVLLNGPGIAVFAGAFEADVVERASVVFHQIIDAEKAAGVASGDHFAKAGANDRVWNALEKMALRDPGTFADYYANDIVALASTAWLGPAYQVTSQVNVVNPGGQAQEPHSGLWRTRWPRVSRPTSIGCRRS